MKRLFKITIFVVVFLVLAGQYITNYSIITPRRLPPDQASRLATIITTYKPSDMTCLTPINKFVYNPNGGDEKLQLACLIAGKRSVVLTERKIAEQLFGSQMLAILASQNIKVRDFSVPRLVYNAVFYSPDGERSALLLIKSMLIKKENDRVNDYLAGGELIAKPGEPGLRKYGFLASSPDMQFPHYKILEIMPTNNTTPPTDITTAMTKGGRVSGKFAWWVNSRRHSTYWIVPINIAKVPVPVRSRPRIHGVLIFLLGSSPPVCSNTWSTL